MKFTSPLLIIILLVVTLTTSSTVEAGKIRLRRGSVLPPAANYADPLPDFGMRMNGQFVANGIEVASVERNGPAANAGLEPGDVLLSVNGQPLREPEDWVRGMSNQNGFLHFRLRDIRTGQVMSRDVELR
jgi:S1-C subfamily serine protease